MDVFFYVEISTIDEYS